MTNREALVRALSDLNLICLRVGPDGSEMPFGPSEIVDFLIQSGMSVLGTRDALAKRGES